MSQPASAETGLFREMLDLRAANQAHHDSIGGKPEVEAAARPLFDLLASFGQAAAIDPLAKRFGVCMGPDELHHTNGARFLLPSKPTAGDRKKSELDMTALGLQQDLVRFICDFVDARAELAVSQMEWTPDTAIQD